MSDKNEKPATVAFAINTQSADVGLPVQRVDTIEALRNTAIGNTTGLALERTTTGEMIPIFKTISQDVLAQLGSISAEKGGLVSIDAASRLKKNGYVFLFGGFCFLMWCSAAIIFLSYYPLPQLDGVAPSPYNLGLVILLLIVIHFQAAFYFWQDWSSSSTISIPASEVVVGDIVEIKLGNKIPADCIILEASHDLAVDRSILTGESIPVSASAKCTDPSYMESKNAVVAFTGDNTVMGQLPSSGKKKSERTLLQKEVDNFVVFVASIAFTCGVACMLVWGFYLNKQPIVQYDIIGMLGNLCGIIVAFVPEGLPIAVSVSLTLIARRMSKQFVLVKNLTTIETLGAVTIICTTRRYQGVSAKAKAFSTLLRSMCAAEFVDDESVPLADRTISGDATDKAVLLRVFDGATTMFVKGAPDVIYPKITRIVNADGSISPFDDAAKLWAGEGKRDCQKLMDDLVLVGLGAIVDPPRPETKDTVEKCKKAHIRVAMVNKKGKKIYERAEPLKWRAHRALYFWKEIDGLTTKTGTRFVATGACVWTYLCEQKLKIVDEFKIREEVVAVTGDGVNDSLLKAANVGVAMGEVLKIYFDDTPPRNPRRSLVNGQMFIHVYLFMVEAGIPFNQLVFMYGALTTDPVVFPNNVTMSLDDVTKYSNAGNSVYFVCLVICQLFGNMYCARTRFNSVFQQNPFWGPTKNLNLLYATVISLSVAALFVYTPWLNGVFNSAPIPAMYWFIPLPCGMFIIMMDELRKLAVRTYGHDSIVGRYSW
ncbi:calcium ATPase, partial [Rhizoclosmatium globosum]